MEGPAPRGRQRQVREKKRHVRGGNANYNRERNQGWFARLRSHVLCNVYLSWAGKKVVGRGQSQIWQAL